MNIDLYLLSNHKSEKMYNKMSSFEMLGYSNVIHISEYLCYCETFDCLSNTNSIVKSYISKSHKTLKRKVELQKKIINGVLYHIGNGFVGRERLIRLKPKFNLDLRTNEDYLHLSANFKDLYELIPEYMYLILNAHKRLQQLLCKYYKNIVSTEKRYLLCRNIYSGDNYKKPYLHIVFKDFKCANVSSF